MLAHYRIETKNFCRAKKKGTSSGSTVKDSTAAAAYRSGESIRDERTGKLWNYEKRKADVLYKDIIMPEGITWKPGREELWNSVERENVRCDSRTAREYNIALPKEFGTDEERYAVVYGFVQELSNRYSVAADITFHRPRYDKKDKSKHNGNYHSHVMLTTDTITNDGFGNKCRLMNEKVELEYVRKLWETHLNQALEKAKLELHVDCRTLAKQGIDRLPEIKEGPRARGMDRDKGIETTIIKENKRRKKARKQGIEEPAKQVIVKTPEYDGPKDLNTMKQIEAETGEELKLVRQEMDELLKVVLSEAHEAANLENAIRDKAIKAPEVHTMTVELETSPIRTVDVITPVVNVGNLDLVQPPISITAKMVKLLKWVESALTQAINIIHEHAQAENVDYDTRKEELEREERIRQYEETKLKALEEAQRRIELEEQRDTRAEGMTDEEIKTTKKGLQAKLNDVRDRYREEFIMLESTSIHDAQEERVDKLHKMQRTWTKHLGNKPIMFGFQDWEAKRDEIMAEYRALWVEAGGDADAKDNTEIQRRRTEEYAKEEASKAWPAAEKELHSQIYRAAEKETPGIIQTLKDLDAEAMRRREERNPVGQRLIVKMQDTEYQATVKEHLRNGKTAIQIGNKLLHADIKKLDYRVMSEVEIKKDQEQKAAQAEKVKQDRAKAKERETARRAAAREEDDRRR